MRSIAPLLAAGVLAMCAGSAFAQPANDLCTGATDITAVGFPYVSGTVNIGPATNDNIAAALPSGLTRPECESASAPAGTLNRGVWWKYSNGAAASRISLSETSAVDVLMTVYEAGDGTCGTLAYQFCVDTGETTIPFNLKPNTTYFIATSRWGTTVPVDPTNINMTINVEAATATPANNTCAAAFAISGPGGSDSRDIGGAINSLPPATCQASGVSSAGGSAYFPIWYSYTSGATLEGFTWTETSTEDVVVTFFTGSCGALTQLTCLDGGSGPGETGSVTLTPSTPYLIRVSRRTQNALAALSLPITFGWTIVTPPPAPANATCASATVISTLPYASGPVAIAGSPNDASVNPSCDSAANPAAAVNPTWWSFTPASTGVYRFVETTSTDVVATLWSGACGGGQTQIVCDDFNVDTTSTGLIQSLTGGTTVYIALSRFSAAVGGFGDTVNLSVEQLAGPANDACSSAVVVTAPTNLPATNVDARAAQSDVGLSCNTTGFTASTTAGVWYQVNNPTADWQNVTYTETSANTDSIWGVFTGASCGALTNVLCQTADTANTFAVAPGQTLYFLVGRQGSLAQPTSAISYTVAFSFATLTSACCNTAANTCTVVSASACATAGGTWDGPRNVTCSVATALATACALAPGNDLCPNAVVISGSLPQLLNTANAASATDDIDASCNSPVVGGGSPPFFTRFGVWYSYTTGLDPGTLSLSELNASNDVVIQTFTGPCNALVPAGCLDAVDFVAGGNFLLNANTTYYILVGMFGNNSQPSTTAISYQLSVNSFTAVTGACCNVTSCAITTASACSGLWLGANTACVGSYGPPNFSTSLATPAAIPDASLTGVSVPLTVSGSVGTISTLVVRVDLSLHTFAGDVILELQGPNSTTARLFARPAATANCTTPTVAAAGTGNDINAGTYFFADAGAATFASAAVVAAVQPGVYKPSNCADAAVSLDTAFAGISADGTWTLRAFDLAASDLGTIVNFGLIINGTPVGPCDTAGSCCNGTACTLVSSAASCTGTYTIGQACGPTNPCTPSTQVCCRGVTCAIIDPALCIAPPGIGISTVTGTTCAGQSAIFAGCCYADFNKSGVKDVADIFAFLSAWFANSPFSDVGGDGTGTRDVSDIFQFLSAWFVGCT